MFAPDHVVVPRLTSGSWVFWTVGTAVATVAIAVYYGITQPENRWAAVLVLAGTAITALGVVSARTWIEPATGTIGRKLFWCLQRRTSLRSATSISLVNNRAGGLHLGIKHRRTLYVPVVTLTDYVERSQSPEILGLLADQIDTHVPSGRPTAVLLRRQVDSIAAGGAAPDSPLAAMTSRGALNATKAGGIGGLSG
jgi:hypothetical protein